MRPIRINTLSMSNKSEQALEELLNLAITDTSKNIFQKILKQILRDYEKNGSNIEVLGFNSHGIRKDWKAIDDIRFIEFVAKFFGPKTVYDSEVRCQMNMLFETLMSEFKYKAIDAVFTEMSTKGVPHMLNIFFARKNDDNKNYPRVISVKISLDTWNEGSEDFKLQIFKLCFDRKDNIDWILWTPYIYNQYGIGHNYLDDLEAYFLDMELKIGKSMNSINEVRELDKVKSEMEAFEGFAQSKSDIDCDREIDDEEQDAEEQEPSKMKICSAAEAKSKASKSKEEKKSESEQQIKSDEKEKDFSQWSLESMVDKINSDDISFSERLNLFTELARRIDKSVEVSENNSDYLQSLVNIIKMLK